MVQITQTDEEIKIVIELNRLITRKPDVVVLPTYLKFNNPPIFFERHLAQEIDDMASYCRIVKNEARIVLVKKQKGRWPELFQNFSKEELLKRRLEISNQLVEKNKERDKALLERFEQKRRTEVEKEVQRETAMRERVKQFQEKARRESLQIDTQQESKRSNINNKPFQISKTVTEQSHNKDTFGTPTANRHTALAPIRNEGKINISFSKFNSHTPKRESQKGVTKPFKVEENVDYTQ